MINSATTVQPRPVQRCDLERITASWQRAFDADYRALNAAKGILPASVVGTGLRSLVEERHATATLLAQFGRITATSGTAGYPQPGSAAHLMAAR
jgi:hypothetical protein